MGHSFTWAVQFNWIFSWIMEPSHSSPTAALCGATERRSRASPMCPFMNEKQSVIIWNSKFYFALSGWGINLRCCSIREFWIFFLFKKTRAYKYLSHGLSFCDFKEKFKIRLHVSPSLPWELAFYFIGEGLHIKMPAWPSCLEVLNVKPTAKPTHFPLWVGIFLISLEQR